VPKDGVVAEWFAKPHATRSIGAGYTEQFATNFLAPQVVTDRYDALFFIEKTTSARPVEGGQRPTAQRLAAPANLDFENGDLGKPPVDWVAPPGLGNFDFQVALSADNPRSGKQCVVITRTPGQHYGETFGSLNQQLDATAYRGKRIKLRASVRTEVNGPGNQAYLWLRVARQGFGPQAQGFYDNMAGRPITTSAWRDYEIAGEVAADAVTIDYGLALVGEGRAWVDAVMVEIADTQ
jgi:hypothetical protein